MSTLGLPIPTSSLALTGVLELVRFFTAARELGEIAVMCAVREEAHHELEVTQHPVEQGTAIADHAFLKPNRLVLQYGWSDSLNEFGGGFGHANSVYRQLKDLQASRQPFTVKTPRASYKNMLMTLLSVPTTAQFPVAFVATIHCQEVILVDVEQKQVPALSSAIGNNSIVNVGQVPSVMKNAPETLGLSSGGLQIPSVADLNVAPLSSVVNTGSVPFVYP